MRHETVPGLKPESAASAVDTLQDRLVGLIDLQLALKHIHWNVVGMSFIAVHEMLDEHVDATREMTDDVAERIAILGGTPNGTPGNVVAKRTWDDYALGRDHVLNHLEALDAVYDGMISDHRSAIAAVADVDPITEDLLIAQTAKLELFQWFVRSHIETGGSMPTASNQPDVSEPYREMTKIGANVKGEGAI